MASIINAAGNTTNSVVNNILPTRCDAGHKIRTDATAAQILFTIKDPPDTTDGPVTMVYPLKDIIDPNSWKALTKSDMCRDTIIHNNDDHHMVCNPTYLIRSMKFHLNKVPEGFEGVTCMAVNPVIRSLGPNYTPIHFLSSNPKYVRFSGYDPTGAFTKDGKFSNWVYTGESVTLFDDNTKVLDQHADIIVKDNCLKSPAHLPFCHIADADDKWFNGVEHDTCIVQDSNQGIKERETAHFPPDCVAYEWF